MDGYAVGAGTLEQHDSEDTIDLARDRDLTVELPVASDLLEGPHHPTPPVTPPSSPPPTGGDEGGDADSDGTLDADPAADVAPVGRAGAGLPVWRTALIVLSCLLLAFLFDISVIGGLRHSRDQSNAYAHFRAALANSEAPVGPTDFNGKLLSSGTPVALLDIPSIHVHEVVREGTTSGVLIGGPGHLRDTVLPGQSGTSVIFGRRAAYGGPFRDIGSLKVGATMTATTGQGVRTFTVVDVRRGGDPLPPAAELGSRITLVTAAGSSYLPGGLLEVDADLTDRCTQTVPATAATTSSCVQPTPTQVVGAASLAKAELALHGDHSALVPLLLWLEALLAAAVGVTWFAGRRGRTQAWLIGLPIILVTTLASADQIARLLPNLM